MICKISGLICCLIVIPSTRASKKVARNALPREIFRDDVEPQRGGKVPEAARDPERIELNKQDAVGLNDEENEIIDENNFNAGFFKSPFADDDYASDFPYNPVFDPIKISGSGGENYAIAEEPKYSNPYAVMYDSLFNKPEKKPSKPRKKISKDTYKYIDIDPSPPKTAYNGYEPPPSTYQEPYQQPYEDPYQDSYQEPYQKPYQEPYQEPYQPYIEPPSYDYSPGYDYSPPANDAYAPPAPTYEPEPYLPPKPVGPVLLEKRPYEVKSVQPLPITVAETYTSFDCRNKHPGRHYADPEAQCQVYHYCHHDGKQDTFECGYGTFFNEYIGTCDYKSNVVCTAGDGYISSPHHQGGGGYPPEPSYNPPQQSYHQPESYHSPQQSYHESNGGFFSDTRPQNVEPFTNFRPF